MVLAQVHIEGPPMYTLFLLRNQGRPGADIDGGGGGPGVGPPLIWISCPSLWADPQKLPNLVPSGEWRLGWSTYLYFWSGLSDSDKRSRPLKVCWNRPYWGKISHNMGQGPTQGYSRVSTVLGNKEFGDSITAVKTVRKKIGLVAYRAVALW